MSYYADNWEMEEENSGDFTITASGVTVYSKWSDVTKFAGSELLISKKGIVSDATGGTLTFTLQVFDHPTDIWYDHAATFSNIVYNGGGGANSNA